MTIRSAMQGTTPPTEEDIEPPADAVIHDDQHENKIEEQVPDSEQPAWLAILQADTPTDQVHQRQAMNRAGQPVIVNGQPLMLDYVTARFVQDRLDAAVGPANWQTAFESLVSGAVRCGLGINTNPYGTEDRWVWKWDVGVPSNIEPDKGAHSDAFKRAGVQWGIARDLYDDRDEKAMQPQPQQAAVMAQPQVQGQQVAMGPNGQPPPGIQYTTEGQAIQPTGAAPPTMGWLCPLHSDAKIVPAGQSKKPPYRNYAAFYACPVPGCDQKGPSVT